MLKQTLILSILVSAMIACQSKSKAYKESDKPNLEQSSYKPNQEQKPRKEGYVSQDPCSKDLEKSAKNCKLSAFGATTCLTKMNISCEILQASLRGMGTVMEVSSCPPNHVGCCKDLIDGSVQAHYSDKSREKNKCIKNGDIWMEP
jgi:hypothetical protein